MLVARIYSALVAGLVLSPGLALAQGVDLTVPGAQELPASIALNSDPAKSAEDPMAEPFRRAVAAYEQGNLEAARDGFRELAAVGHGISAYDYALMSWWGQGGGQDRALAIKFFDTAAKQEVPQSLHALGVLYLQGNGVAKDPSAAVGYFTQASQLGYAASTYNLALAHLNGWGIDKDPAAGRALLEVAAEQGFPEAAYDLAGLLAGGVGGERDPVSARHWFAKAAEAGDPFGHYNLALMALAGSGGGKDPALARRHLEIAAEAGAVPAQIRLAYFLAGGEGGRRDRVGALAWFRIAAGLGDASAAENAKRLAGAMPAADVAAAGRRAEAFQPHRSDAKSKRTGG
ncbi:MAG: tetratricopeptide repeat protein [Proteobacteria bacterium]|nr:tetratricopeptide repeat protein [Pseudomonadota bacterium]